MLLSITLDDKDGTPVSLHSDSGNCAIVNANGLVGVGGLRESRRDRPQGHGGIDETRWESGRIVSLVLEVSGQGATLEDAQEAAYANARAVIAPMLDTLDYGPALLKWTEASTGNQLQRYVRLAGDIDPPIADHAARLMFPVQFFAEDPAAYTQAETTTGAALSGGAGGMVFPDPFPIVFSPDVAGALAINNVGNRKSPPTFRIYGACTNPRIILVETREMITLSGSVALGDYVELNTDTRTLMLNGVTNVGSMLDSANTQWFTLPRGVSTVRLLADSYDTNTSLTVLYRSAYA